MTSSLRRFLPRLALLIPLLASFVLIRPAHADPAIGKAGEVYVVANGELWAIE